jgi:signal transduction histidine kinase
LPFVRLADRHTPGRIAYELLSFPLGTTYFVFLVTGLAVGLGTSVTLLGLPLLVGMLFAWRGLARFERRLLGLTLGLDLPDPYRPLRSAGVLGRLRERLADPATWKDLVYLFLTFPLGLVSFSICVVLVSLAAGCLLAPLWYWALDGGVTIGSSRIDTFAEAVFFVPVGVLATGVGLVAVQALAAMHGWTARLLLGSSPDPELSARVEDLQGSRARIIAAADAERRRLERDLHDGAQQRLVAVSLVLGLARRRLTAGQDPPSCSRRPTRRPGWRSPSCATSRAGSTPRSSPIAVSRPPCTISPRAPECPSKCSRRPRSGSRRRSRRRPTSSSPRR